MTLQEFIAKYNGKGIDFDGAYGDQCVDLMNQYLVEVLGIASPISELPGATAFQIYENANSQHFDKIANSPDGVPLPGDIVFWNTSIGAAGHVAVFATGDQNQFTSFDQNWPQGSLCHEQGHNYNGVAGWLHPKNALPSGTFVDAQTFTKLVDESSKYENFQKSGYTTIDEVIAKVNTLQSQVDNLNKEVGEKQNVVNSLEAEVAHANADYSGIVAELQKIKSDDSEVGLRNIDVSHQLDTAQGLIQSHYKHVNASDESSYQNAIKALQESHEAVVKQVQPTIEALADAAILKKQPVKKPNSIVLFIKGFLHL